MSLSLATDHTPERIDTECTHLPVYPVCLEVHRRRRRPGVSSLQKRRAQTPHMQLATACICPSTRVRDPTHSLTCTSMVPDSLMASNGMPSDLLLASVCVSCEDTGRHTATRDRRTEVSACKEKRPRSPSRHRPAGRCCCCCCAARPGPTYPVPFRGLQQPSGLQAARPGSRDPGAAAALPRSWCLCQAALALAPALDVRSTESR